MTREKFEIWCHNSSLPTKPSFMQEEKEGDGEKTEVTRRKFVIWTQWSHNSNLPTKP